MVKKLQLILAILKMALKKKVVKIPVRRKNLDKMMLDSQLTKLLRTSLLKSLRTTLVKNQRVNSQMEAGPLVSSPSYLYKELKLLRTFLKLMECALMMQQ